MTKARQLADLGNAYDDGALSNRNLIINGAMQVAQRGTSFSDAGYDEYTVDRFTQQFSGIDQAVVNYTQDTDAPDGYSNSLKLTVGTAETAIDTTEYYAVTQKIEAQNLQHLAYNTSSAKSTTLSFWVKGSLTGTYAIALYIGDSSRIIGSTYTINTASTWEYKTITFAGDTSGGIDNNNGEGIALYFFMAAGPDRKTTDNTSWGAYASGKFGYGQSVQVLETASATWQITGVQLEVGDTATPFEHRSYGDELARCQRYFEKFTIGDGYRPNAIAWSTGNTNAPVPFGVQKRASPTLTVQDDGQIFTGSWVDADDVVIAGTGPTVHGCTLDVKKASSFTVKYGYFLRNQIFSVDAEL